MGQLNIGKFRGLDLRTNEFNKSHSSSSDLLNVELDSDSSLKKRYGHELIASVPSNCVGLVEYKEKDELIAFATDGIHKSSGGAFSQITTNPTGIGWSEMPSTVEVSGVLYIADPSGTNVLYKYDGTEIVYTAGLKKPVQTGGANTGTGYDVKLALRFVDNQLNVHYSDVYEVYDIATLGKTFRTPSNPSYGAYNKYAQLSGSSNLSKTNNVITTTGVKNIVAGDKILVGVIYTNLPNQLSGTALLTVDSVGAGSITVNQTELDNAIDSLSSPNDTGGPYFIRVSQYLEPFRCMWIPFISPTGDNRYLAPDFNEIVDIDLHLFVCDLQNSFQTLNFPLSFYTGSAYTDPMEDFYDSVIVKGAPPKCRYITYYNNTLVLGNKVPDIFNPTIDTIPNAVNKNLIHWSDKSVGSSLESFSPLDFEIIGKTSEGGITGLFGGPNYLSVFKELRVYSIDGLLTNKSYRIKDSLSPRVGCITHESISELIGAGLFMSNRGIYLATSAEPKEASDLIEPLFTKNLKSLDFTGTKSSIDTVNEKILFYVPYESASSGVIIVYDYYHREWFLWDGMDCSRGLVNYSGEIYFANDSGVFKVNTSYSDAGSSISAYYKSSYIHLGEPAIRKKFTDIAIFALSGEEFTCNVQHDEDWNEQVLTDTDIEFDGVRLIEHKNINQNLCNSFRYILSNDKNNEALSINGVSIEYEAPQIEMKVR